MDLGIIQINCIIVLLLLDATYTMVLNKSAWIHYVNYPTHASMVHSL